MAEKGNEIKIQLRTRGHWRLKLAMRLIEAADWLLAGVRMETRWGSEHWREMPERIHVDAKAEWRAPKDG